MIVTILPLATFLSEKLPDVDITTSSPPTKPPLLPLANVIELTVTVVPVPTFLLLNVEPTVWPKVSDPTSPVKVNVVVAVVVPS